VTLSAEDARVIYQVKINGKHASDANRLATQYGITAKAVRDVWNHRTWVIATIALWEPEEARQYTLGRLCARCREAVRMRHIEQVCRKCKQFIRRIKMLRDGVEGAGQGAHEGSGSGGATGGATGSNSDANSTGSPPGSPFQRRTADNIWRERDRDHRGLLEEGLRLIETGLGAGQDARH